MLVLTSDPGLKLRIFWRPRKGDNIPDIGHSGNELNHAFKTQSEPGMPQLYAVKHNPFAYFASVQAGTTEGLSLKQITDFHALFADLNSGHVPNLAFIAPNQCHDQHARGSSEMGRWRLPGWRRRNALGRSS